MTATLVPSSTDEVAELLRSSRRVRIRGSGSRQLRLPDPGDAAILDLCKLDTIERLDGPDQTCTVGPGVRRETLDAALAEHDLELGCLGGGTIAGLCASDALGAASLGAPCPRSLVLGMDAVLADGTGFRSGARVVKNVAGFDLHKLFVGSRGSLFVATRLHLRLRPRPRAAVWFSLAGLSADAALQRFVALRSHHSAPAVLRLSRRAGAFTLAGKATGRPSLVRSLLSRYELREGEPFAELHLQPPVRGEVLAGNLAPSRLPALLDHLPPAAELLLYGGGRCEIALPDAAATDALLRALPDVPCAAAIVSGDDQRRGRGTPLDPGQTKLNHHLKAALDPDGKFV